GETIHVLARDEVDASALRTRLDLPSDAPIRPIEPTLEDVFVTLTRNASSSLSPSRGEGRVEGLAAEPSPRESLPTNERRLFPSPLPSLRDGEREEIARTV